LVEWLFRLVYHGNVGTSTEYRYDPDSAREFILELAQERSLAGFLQKLVHHSMTDPAIALLPVWLIDSGDICSTCTMRTVCPDQTRCLHAAASGGNSISNLKENCPRCDDWLARVPLGVGIVGQIAETGKPIVIREFSGETEAFAPHDWLKREQVRGFHGAPVVYQGEVLGVIAVFTRVPIPDEAVGWLRACANHIAGAVVNERAFEEIRRHKAQLESENAYLQQEVAEAKALGDIIGQSPSLRHTISQIDVVAPTDATVLILGETGTGKELVAREIHHRSRRNNKPLIRVNCASVPKELYESEFFGHAKGAFTGAIRDRAGRFEVANGGTLFLDEIAEVPLELQSKFLRVLQEKRYERVGEDKTRSVDVRIIVATNRDLQQEVEAGRFRGDLFYRLNVFPIQVSPLRDRREDIPLLTQHFIDLSVKELRCPQPRLTRSGVAKLQNYDWPGNVRELRNVIERAVILARGGALDFDLPASDSSPLLSPVAPRDGDMAEPEFLTEAELRNRERHNLVVILEKAGWKIQGPDGAAELLGVKPTTLISRIKKMGLKQPKQP